MQVKKISTNGEVIAHIYDLNDVAGKNFPTPDDFPMQFGVGLCETEWTSPAHIHKRVERTVDATAEFIFILKGTLEAVFYDEDEQIIETQILTDQMALLQIRGGHQLTFGKGTTYFELKQGPYLGRDADKYSL